MRHQASGWTKALSVSRQIENQVGFIGIDYIDDSSPFWAYAVQFYDHRTDGRKAFAISLAYMADEKDTDELPIEITWNEATGRYQEFTMNKDPEGFQPELRNPPHR
jgi:hypothetical protein